MDLRERGNHELIFLLAVFLLIVFVAIVLTRAFVENTGKEGIA
jgi:hypothetical protein